MTARNGAMSPVVLVADDEEDILELVEIVLEEEGYDVLTASDGEQALALALERRPDLYLLDVMMPRLDGVELTRALRQQGLADVPVIMLTAKTSRESVEVARHAGADEYITKPFIPDDLLRSVRSMLREPAAEAAALPPGIELTSDPVPPPIHIPAGSNGASAHPRIGGKVLIAAADQNTRRLLRYCLDLGGYQVFEAGDGNEAVAMAESCGPDLCVFEAGLPGVDGYAATRALRGDGSSSPVPVLLVTERADPDAGVQAVACGANGFIQRPFGAPELYEHVRALMAEAPIQDGDASYHADPAPHNADPAPYHADPAPHQADPAPHQAGV